MVGKPVVFIGPTLARAQAAAILDAVYLPPAEQGSVVRAVRTHAPAPIVLIDGSFGKVPAVRHKEILWALAKGIPVFGAASIGALRAAELSACGMKGHGFIYRWYAATLLADDDEVAVAMGPPEIGARPLSEALINIRLTLRCAMRLGIVTAGERRTLEALARGTHFVDRSYDRLLGDARSTSPVVARTTLDRLAKWLPSGAVDRKRDDAIGLLTQLARHPVLPGKCPAALPFVLTEAWAYDLDAAALGGDDIVSFVAE